MKQVSGTSMPNEDEENIYQDIYNSCCELIDPYIKQQSNGMYSIGKDSLIPSVVEFLDYLIKFWVENREKVK